MKEVFNLIDPPGLGPLFDISVLVYLEKLLAAIENDDSQDISESNKIGCFHKVINILKKEFAEIELIEDEDKINADIKMFWEEPFVVHSRALNINAILNLGYNRDARVLLTTRDDVTLMICISCIEEDDNDPCRDDAMKLLTKLMDKLNGYCGTTGIEADALDIGFPAEYGIIEVVRNKANEI
ncbi:MAG: hypothetical protein FWB99_01565 [Treponema sp.]|nr:hypothetical protein [Treponema sp.]